MKYALFGYTYQHYLDCLLLAMMDVERKIQKITLEADVDHKFGDITISCEDKNYCIQIKDIDGIKPNEISVTAGQIKISGKDHKLSGEIIFFLRTSNFTRLQNSCFPGPTQGRCLSYIDK